MTNIATHLEKDLQLMVSKLSKYNEDGLPVISERPSRHIMMIDVKKELLKPLTKVTEYNGVFLAVDCSTRTLRRANNWAVYLLRSAYTLVRDREDIAWHHQEDVVTLLGSSFDRFNALKDERLEIESSAALSLLDELDTNDYILLDGVSLFGGGGRFRVDLYNRCERKAVRLLAVSKRTPSLRDVKGRDGLTAISAVGVPKSIWYYYPARKANKDVGLYGDVSVVKLLKESPRIFRCDIMSYLTNMYEPDELLSPLTFVSDDARCLGYPVPLYLAHKFTTPHKQQLLYYYDLVNEHLPEELRRRLDMEELTCNFPDVLHGVKYPFEWEVMGGF